VARAFWASPVGATAVATLALAILALATAFFAWLAWRGQSSQIELLRDQLDDQRKLNEEQTPVLKLQVDELRESLKEQERERQVAERQQADGIGFQMTNTPFPDLGHYADVFTVRPGNRVCITIVSNESRRPIKNVVCRMSFVSTGQFDATPDDTKLPVLVGELAAPTLSADRAAHWVVMPVPAHDWFRIRPGEKYGFVFEVQALDVLMKGAAVRFTDDAGLHWQIDLDQHLQRVTNRDW
jgi:hypothetical protein